VITRGAKDDDVRKMVGELARDPKRLDALDRAQDQERVVEQLLTLGGVYTLTLAKSPHALAFRRQQMAKQLVFHAKDAATALVWRLLLIACNTPKVLSIGAWVAQAVQRALRDNCRDAPMGSLQEVTRRTCSSKQNARLPKETEGMARARQTKLEQFAYSWNEGHIPLSVLEAMKRANLTLDDLAHHLGITREALDHGIADRMQRKTG
jgi:hypothetical protein